MLWATSPIMTKPLSIITNFGCARRCVYCIWKYHPLRDCFTTYGSTDWEKLNYLLANYTVGKISISGGGDPLFDIEGNRRWWYKMLDLATRHELKMSIHTREFVPTWIKPLDQVVVSLDCLNHRVKEETLQYLRRGVRVRLCKVITADTTISQLSAICMFAGQHGIRVTFKQLWGSDDNGNYQCLKQEHIWLTNVMFLPHGDYNQYFMPDNSLWDSFITRNTL